MNYFEFEFEFEFDSGWLGGYDELSRLWETWERIVTFEQQTTIFIVEKACENSFCKSVNYGGWWNTLQSLYWLSPVRRQTFTWWRHEMETFSA